MPADATALLQLDLRRCVGDFSLSAHADINASGVTGIFGPSGSGKSTLLRGIAGLDTAVSGIVRFGDEVWLDSANGNRVAAHQRGVGYVFQDARLFTHLNVAGNLQFAAKRANSSLPGPDSSSVSRMLDLDSLMQRDVSTLSGGERQRVALGRALLSKPRLLLLDEPLAALDAGRKNEILPYLASLRESFGIPTLYVSHAVDEIARLADSVLVMAGGKVTAQGETVEVLNSLQPPARFETASIIEAQVTRQLPDLHLTELEFHGQRLYVPELKDRRSQETVRLQIRASDVALARTKPRKVSIQNILRGRLHDIIINSDSAFVTVMIDISGILLRAHVTRQAMIALDLAAGEEIFALLKTATFDDNVPPQAIASCRNGTS